MTTFDLAQVFARNKQMFGDFRMEADPDPAGDPAPAPTVQRGPGSDGNKPVSEMTVDEKADYFSKKADRLQGILKGYDGLTLDQLAEMRDKASKHDALEHELMSDRDKAVAEARKAAETDTRSSFLPRLATAELKAAAAAKGVPADKLASALEFVDTGRFLKGDDVDSEMVAKFIDGIAPAAPATPKGPSSFGLGARTPSGGAPGEQGKAQAAKRFGAKA